MSNEQSPLVIYIEDDEDDQELCNIALEDVEHDIRLEFLSDGETAVDYFSRLKDVEQDEWPSLILLDLSMPAINGWDILAHVRSEDELSALPVVVFTTSNSPTDRRRAYTEGANAYMVKPAGLAELSECLDTTLNYWIKVVGNNNLV